MADRINPMGAAVYLVKNGNAGLGILGASLTAC